MSTPICSRFCPFVACDGCAWQGGVSEDVSAGESGCSGVTDNRMEGKMDPTTETAPAGASTPVARGLATTDPWRES